MSRALRYSCGQIVHPDTHGRLPNGDGIGIGWFARGSPPHHIKELRTALPGYREALKLVAVAKFPDRIGQGGVRGIRRCSSEDLR